MQAPQTGTDPNTRSNLHRVPKTEHAQNLPGHVQQMLLEAILTRVLMPGERLLIDGIAAHFGISKIPVREAVKALVASGWLESMPRRGTYVRTLSEQELREVFEMRRMLEPYAARKAAERRTPERLAELRELIAEGLESIRRRDIVSNARVNSCFHSVIAEAVGNRIICESLKDLQSRIRRYYVETEWKIRRESFAEHRRIYEAIRDQDADLAESLTNEHLDHAESFAQRPAK
ncbi:MAG: GntR family transcriptional regulator [Betaproteobacteria bacterium]|nr:GntR family transcriptional regulator [Betaproteobacteria bacterium]